MPATGSSTSSSRTSVSTVLWPPPCRSAGGRGRGPGGGRGNGGRGGRGRHRRRRRRRRGQSRLSRSLRLSAAEPRSSSGRVAVRVRGAAVVGAGRSGAVRGAARSSRAVRARAAVVAAVLPAVAPAAVAGTLGAGLGSDVDGRSGHRCTVLALVGAVGPVAARTALARASGGGLAVGLDGGGPVVAGCCGQRLGGVDLAGRGSGGSRSRLRGRHGDGAARSLVGVAGTPPSAVAAPLRGEPAGREATRRRRAAAGASSTVDSRGRAVAVRAGAAGVGSESCGAGPPAWRSLIAAMRSPLRIFAVSAMFNSPASWRSSASTIVLRPLRRVGAAVPPGVSGAPASGAVPAVTRSVSLTKVLPDRPGTFPGQRISCSSGRCAGRLSG